jgi:hypothetical protein
MSTNKTIGGLSVLSSANIKGCYSLAVWDTDAQTTKSACITDVLAGVQSLYVLGSGTCSSLRCGVGNLASGNYSASLGGQLNCATGIFSMVGGGCGNRATGYASIVGGGTFNTASGTASLVVGGQSNTASGLQSVALGFSNTGYKTDTPFNSIIFIYYIYLQPISYFIFILCKKKSCKASKESKIT